MKKLLSFLLLLSGALLVSTLPGQGIDQAGAQEAVAGFRGQTSTGPVYALSNAISNTVSSTIDMSGSAMMFVSVSGTPGGRGVQVEWSMDAAAGQPWVAGEILQQNDVKPIYKRGNSVRFRVRPGPSQLDSGISANSYTTVSYELQQGNSTPGSSSGVGSYAELTFTATGGAVNGATVVSAISGKTIVVIGYGISTDTAGQVVLHHQAGAVSRSNSAGNEIGGGQFGANGGEAQASLWRQGLAQNQPVTVDISGAMTSVHVWVQYITF